MVLHIRKVGKLVQLWEGIWSCFWLVHCPFPSTEMCYLSCQHLACITFSTSSCPSLRLHSSRNKSDGGVPQVFTSLANDHFILHITHFALKCWSLRWFYFIYLNICNLQYCMGFYRTWKQRQGRKQCQKQGMMHKLAFNWGFLTEVKSSHLSTIHIVVHRNRRITLLMMQRVYVLI